MNLRTQSKLLFEQLPIAVAPQQSSSSQEQSAVAAEYSYTYVKYVCWRQLLPHHHRVTLSHPQLCFMLLCLFAAPACENMLVPLWTWRFFHQVFG